MKLIWSGVSSARMTVETLRCGDNFVYLLLEGSAAAVVDPGVAEPVVQALNARGVALDLIMVTHHHLDHTGGCCALKGMSGCRIVGPPGGQADTDVGEGDTVTFARVDFAVMALPGHTANHVAYYSSGQKAVFTGDTLFDCGCGRLFGADAAAMWRSLFRLRELPGETVLYGGHDYTEDNLMFAVNLEPDNTAVRKRLNMFKSATATGDGRPPHSTIAEERHTNPFLRCDSPEVMQAVNMQTAQPAEVFAEVRRRKDRW